MRPAEVAAAVDGTCDGPDVEIDGASIDSRTLRGRELFVPVRGERDGHDFIGAAVAGGAAAYLTGRGDTPLAAGGATAIRVTDPQAALLPLGPWVPGKLR